MFNTPSIRTSFVSTANSKYVHFKILLMTGFKLQTSCIGSNRSAN